MSDYEEVIAYLSPIAGPLCIIGGIICFFNPSWEFLPFTLNWKMGILGIIAGLVYLYYGRKHNKK